jgi:hypothetical protein
MNTVTARFLKLGDLMNLLSVLLDVTARKPQKKSVRETSMVRPVRLESTNLKSDKPLV